MGQPIDLDVTEVLILEADERVEFPPPFGHPFVFLHIRADPLSIVAQVSLNTSPGFPGHLGREAAWWGHGGWR